MEKPKGYWVMSNVVSLELLDIEHGIDDKAIVRISSGKPKRVKIKYKDNGRAYVTYNGGNYYLDECTRC